MKQIQLIALLLAAAGLTACSSDEGTGTVDAPLKMIVDVTENPFTDTSSSAKMRGTTRATYTTTESLRAFSMNSPETMNSPEFKYDFEKSEIGGTWTGPNQWPNITDKFDFYAYTGDMGNTADPDDPEHIFRYNDGNPYIAFTVAQSASNQHDLLVAKHEKISYNDAEGHVSLSFDHALAAVQFKVQITNTWKQKNGNALTVNSIVLRNVNDSGNYYYGTKSWDNVSGSAYYTLTSSTSLTVTTDYQELPCGYLFLIPQSRKANGTQGTYIEVNYTFSGQTQTKANIYFDVDWKAGSLYTIEIRLGTTHIK